MPGGRPSNPIVYRDVIYDDKTYIVGTILHNSHPIQFVIDKEDFQKIEFKTEGICWKTTSSKTVSFADKLQEARQKLSEFYVNYPYLNPVFYEERANALLESYNVIVHL